MKQNKIFRLPLLLLALLPALLMSCSMEPEKASFSMPDNLADLQLGNEPTTQTFSIKSNTEWKITNESSQDWASVSPLSGNGDGTITVTVGANTGPGRSAMFRVIPNGGRIREISISQGNVYARPRDGEFPIIAWTGIEANKSLSKFPVMKASGINIYLGWYNDLKTTLKALDDAEKCGVKLITSCPDLQAVTTCEEVVKAMMNHPALYAYHLDDEPEVSDLPWLGELSRKIQTIDSYHPCYINLYPNWAWGNDLYASNVQSFIDQVPVPFISFDNYPIVSINGAPNILRPDWYRNLEEIAAAARNCGKPFWAFALALSHTLDATHVYKIPTLAELRLMVFSDLAYGAQAIQYFTYNGLQRGDEITPVYDLIKSVNTDVQTLAPVFLGCEVVSVAHTGAELPAGTRPLKELPAQVKSLTTDDSGAVVSHIRNNGAEYLVVVNKDFRNPMHMDISLDSSVSRVLKTGATAAAESSVTVEAGDMVIYRWNQ